MLPVTSITEAKEYLNRFRADQSVTIYNLDKITKLMDYLGNPQNDLKIVHVAGTSGKTSTCYYVAALLTQVGQKTGQTVSPHINGINERIQINGEALTEDEFCSAISEFLQLVETAPVVPSWFEVMTAFAYWYFARERVDYAVIEVGLGGLLDGTNVVDRTDKVCIITDIGYDHMHVLGNTLPEIAAQKAGIIHFNNPVFCYHQANEIMQVFEQKATEQSATLNVIEPIENTDANLPDYQSRNLYLARQVYDFLQQRDDLPELNDDQLAKVKQTHIPGRMNILQKNHKTLVLDGAHNQQKMTAMISSFKKLFPDVKPAILMSLKTGKDYEPVVKMIAELSSRVIVTQFDLAQDAPVHSMNTAELAEAVKSAGQNNTIIIEDQVKAVETLLNGVEEVCLVTGSIYLLGQLRSRELV